MVRAKDEEWTTAPGYVFLTERRGILGHIEGHGHDEFHGHTALERLPLTAAERDGAADAWQRLTARVGLPVAVAVVRQAAKRRLGAARAA